MASSFTLMAAMCALAPVQSVGEELTVRVLQADHGHFRIGLFQADSEVGRFDGDIVGCALSQGLSLKGKVASDVASYRQRVDIIMDSSEGPKSRWMIPNAFGTPQVFLFDSLPDADEADLAPMWRPLRMLRWCEWISDPATTTASDPVGPYDAQRRPRRQGLQLIRRRGMFNPTHFSDLDCGLILLSDGQNDIGFLNGALEPELTQLLARETPVEWKWSEVRSEKHPTRAVHLSIPLASDV